MDLNIFIIRISICFVLSIIVGLERQYRHGPVGLRTNVLVALGAFLFNYATYSFLKHDESRIASAIVSGIGFLGAGMIIKDGKSIWGLNTAATLWCVAAIGLLTSVGMIWEAVIGTCFVLLSNIVLRFISFFISCMPSNIFPAKDLLYSLCRNIKSIKPAYWGYLSLSREITLWYET